MHLRAALLGPLHLMFEVTEAAACLNCKNEGRFTSGQSAVNLVAAATVAK